MTEGSDYREYEGDYGELEHRLDSERAKQGGGLTGLIEQVALNIEHGLEQHQYSASERERLEAAAETRGDAPHADTNYPGHSHQEMYDWVHTDLSPEDIDNAGRAANDFGNWLTGVSEALSSAASTEAGAWQGPAAERAGAFFTAAAAWSDSTGQAAQLASNRAAPMADGAANARNAMPEPTGFDQHAELTKAREQLASGDVLGGVQSYNAVQERQAEAEKRKAEAERVMMQLDTNYTQAASSQPAFVPPPDLTGASGDGSTRAAGVIGGTSGGAPSVNAPGMAPGQTPGGGSAGGTSGLTGGRASGVGAPATTGPGGANTPGVPRGPGLGGGMGVPIGTGAGTGRGGDTRRTNPSPFRPNQSGTAKPGQSRAGARISGGSGKAGAAAGKTGSAAPRVSGDKSGPGQGKGTGAQQPQKAAIGPRAQSAQGLRPGGAGGPMGAGAGGRGGKGEDDRERGASDLLKNEDHFNPEERDEAGYRRGEDGLIVSPGVIGDDDPK